MILVTLTPPELPRPGKRKVILMAYTRLPTPITRSHDRGCEVQDVHVKDSTFGSAVPVTALRTLTGISVCATQSLSSRPKTKR